MVFNNEHGNAKLTAKQVAEIRQKRNDMPEVYSLRRLASKFGVSVRCIRDIESGRTWIDIN